VEDFLDKLSLDQVHSEFASARDECDEEYDEEEDEDQEEHPLVVDQGVYVEQEDSDSS
jgi:hypothetical protein